MKNFILKLFGLPSTEEIEKLRDSHVKITLIKEAAGEFGNDMTLGGQTRQIVG